MTITTEKFSSLDRKLDKICQDAQVPGMALAVYEQGKPIYEKYYGYRNVEEQLPVNEDTIFGVASITKSFAALAIMQLADRGKLNIDDPVVKWLPELELPNKEFEKQVKIHHLMSHSSGLPGLSAVHNARAASIAKDPDGAYLFDELEESQHAVKNVVDLMKAITKTDFDLLGAPGETFNYSNESYAMLQGIIERASGQYFLSYMEENIFKPLHMNRSFFLTEDLQKTDNVTELYAYENGKKAVFHSPIWWDVADIYTNGSLKASVSDLMKYLEVYRLRGTVNGKHIVSEQSIQEMTTTQMTTPNDNEYGYGLQIDHIDGVTLVGHGGSIKGVSSNIQLVKDHDLTVAVLINLADVNADGIAKTVVKHLLDMEDKEMEQLTFVHLTTDQVNKYTGFYQSGEGQKVHVTTKNDQLILKVKHNQMIVNPLANDYFITSDQNKGRFIVNQTGEVIGLFIGMRFIPKVIQED